MKYLTLPPNLPRLGPEFKDYLVATDRWNEGFDVYIARGESTEFIGHESSWICVLTLMTEHYEREHPEPPDVRHHLLREHLIEMMAEAAFSVTHHYHESLQWHQAHPEIQDLMRKQAGASLDRIEAYIPLLGGGVPEVPAPLVSPPGEEA